MKILLSVLLVSLLAATGCSISNSSGSLSDSSGSISDSISSPSKSSSDSSGGDDSSGDEKEAPAPESSEDTASYQKDVSQLTVTYIKSGGDLDAFRSGVTRLAKARGITNWEADAHTTRAIGNGAGTAGLDEARFDEFSKALVGTDLTKLNEMRIGYQATSTAGSASTSAGTSAGTSAATSSAASETPAGDTNAS